MNLHRVCLISLLLLFSTTSVVPAGASAVVSTTAEGVGVIKSGNKAMARDQAIRDGLRIAVEQAVGTLVASETLVQNYEVLRDQIYSKTQGYVKDYTIIDEKEEGTLYRVTLKAQVASGNLENDLMALGLLMQRKEMPRIMLMVAEQNVGMHYYSFWWGIQSEHASLAITESILLEQLGQKGFVVVDPAVKAGSIEISQPYRVASLSNEAIISVGKLYEAEVVIYGKALAKLTGSVMNSSMMSAMADVSLRAVNTDNARVIASATNHAAAVHPSKVTAGTNALKTAAESITASLVEQIADRWSQDVSSGGLIQLEIAGVGSYSQLVVFKDNVTQIRGVTGLYQRSYQAGVATLDLKATKGAQTLADEIVGIDYGDFTVDVTGVTQNRIQLKMDGG
jgi:hypothetical protein